MQALNALIPGVLRVSSWQHYPSPVTIFTINGQYFLQAQEAAMGGHVWLLSVPIGSFWVHAVHGRISQQRWVSDSQSG